MKTINVNICKKMLIMLFVILTFVSVFSSVSFADSTSSIINDYFNQTGSDSNGNPKGIYGNVVTYSTKDSTGNNVETKKICFTMPQDMGQDIFVDSGRLLVNGETEVKFSVTFSCGNFTYTFNNPSLNNSKDKNRANLYLSGLVIKKDESGTECVYYDNNKIGTVSEFKNNSKYKVSITSPIQETYESNIGNWKNVNQQGKFFLLVWLEWIKDKALSILSNILTELLLSIGDAIRDLINSIVGEVTLGKVIYNEVEALNVNFWNNGSASSSIGQLLKPLVSFWYGKFQGIVFIIYICVLLFVGIKIMITSTAGSLEKAKELLTSWLLGLVLLMVFPTCMKYIVTINESMVALVKEKSDEVTQNEDKIDAMDKIHDMAKEYSNIPLCIIYIIMLGQLIVLLVVYYKRAFTLAYLIVIFPIVQGYYIYEKVSKRKKFKGSDELDKRIYSCSILTVSSRCRI